MNWKIDSVKSMFLSGYKYCNEIFVVVTDVDLSDHFYNKYVQLICTKLAKKMTICERNVRSPGTS